MNILICIAFSVWIFTLGMDVLERYFGLKEQPEREYQILYFFYKVAFFLSFFFLWCLVFIFLSWCIWNSFEIINNQSLKFYLQLMTIACINIRGTNLVYFIIRISIYDRFKQHKAWLKKSNLLILQFYRFFIFSASLVALISFNILSFFVIDNSFKIFTDNISVLNIAFTTVLGFDAMCEAGIKLYKYIKTLFLLKNDVRL